MAVDREKNCCEWSSVLLRIGAIVLFLTMSISWWIMGAGTAAAKIEGMFQGTGFPHWIVRIWAWGMPYFQVLLAAWFISGLRLRAAWFITGLYIVTLAFGLDILHQYVLKNLAYLSVLFAVAGIYFSYNDDWKFGVDWKKKWEKVRR